MAGVITSRPCAGSSGDRNSNSHTSFDTGSARSKWKAHTLTGSRVHAMRVAFRPVPPSVQISPDNWSSRADGECEPGSHCG